MGTETLAWNFEIPKYVKYTEADDELVIVDMRTDMLIGINGIGLRIWKAICDSQPLHVLISTTMSDYEVTQDVLERDIHELVEQLLADGLIVRVTA